MTPEDRALRQSHILDYWIDGALEDGLRPYLVLDGSWQTDLAQQVRAQTDGWEPLFGAPGDPKEEAHGRAPLLVDLAIRPEIRRPWIEQGAPDKLVIIIFSMVDIDTLRRSLKRFQMVHLPDHTDPAFLLYFDARVLACFLESGYATQWDDFFRDFTTIVAPSDETEGWVIYAHVESGLQKAIAELEATE